MSEKPPRLFISYSWSSPLHEEWVLFLASQLRDNGVDVILDKWGLREGHDAYAFMEKMVTDPDIKKVVMICDRQYKEKADGRKGGVGTEAQIISGEVYSQQDQSKFVAVLPERDEKGDPFLPAYYASRIYIDLSSPDDVYNKGLEQLLRWVYDKPFHVKPELGKPPAFLTDGATISLQTTAPSRRASSAIRENKPYWQSALTEYFETVVENLERFRIVKGNEEFDEQVARNVEEFLPYRNEVVERFLELARYRPAEELWGPLHRFFENLIPYFGPPENATEWNSRDFDNFKFIIHELFLYAVAALIRSERFDGVAHLVRQHYYVRDERALGRAGMVPFSELRQHLESLEWRNTRLQLNRLSVHTDLLLQRSTLPQIPFQELMQADFILFIRDCLDFVRSRRPKQQWWPVTLVYSTRQYGPFEVFARSQSASYFENLKQVFDIQLKEDLNALGAFVQEGKLRIPSWPFQRLGPPELMGLEDIATLP